MLFQEKHFPTDVKNIGIDSKYRDRNKYPSASEYVVQFETIFQSVVSVQLVFAVYEKTGTDSYVNLHIEELSPNLISNSNHISGAFCQLPMINQLTAYDTSFYKCIKHFEKPLAKLSKLSIRFIDSDGNTYPMREHFMKFEISCLRFNGKATEWVNNEMFSQSVSVLHPAVPKKIPVHEGMIDIKINVPETYTMDVLKMAFKSACDMLRSYNLPRDKYNNKYSQLKNEFKELAIKIV